MPLISSPVTYPPSSSPAITSPRKRKRLDEPDKATRSPLVAVNTNSPRTLVGGFLANDDDDDDDDEAFNNLMGKRKRLNQVLQQSAFEIDVEEEEDTLPEHLQERPITKPRGPLAIPSLLEESTSQRATPVQSANTSKEGGSVSAVDSAGNRISLTVRRPRENVAYEQLIAARSTATEGLARTSYYGINIHQLMDENSREEAERAAASLKPQAEAPRPSIEHTNGPKTSKRGRTLMWTEKYRAKKFTDLIGDERTHRSVLRWLKSWDPIVFPGASKPKPKVRADADHEEHKHKKILLLTGPPGLGKTTLAHVCAKQAGYEVQEINASDERSRDVVKGRIKDMVGTENVKGIDTKTATGKVRKAGKPVCVVVDEVDGVVSGSGGGGEGGFIKALIDLIQLDQKSSSSLSSQSSSESTAKRKKKGDRFRLLRPMILICNDVYHPSLRPLRQSSMAEIIHIRKPPLNMVVARMQSIFEKEGIPCDGDGVRRLCEATWGVSTKKEGGTGSGAGEGDIRGVMVVGEWVAGKLRATVDSSIPGTARLTRRWLEQHVLGDLGHGGGAARGLGRGGAKEIAERVFMENAGFPKTAIAVQLDKVNTGPKGVADTMKGRAMDLLREMVNTCGDYDRIVTDCFTSYPSQRFQDDTLLSKPNAASSWLHFHDVIGSAVLHSQEWELAPYLCQTPLAFHHLFASPISGPNSVNAQNAMLRDGEDDSSTQMPFTGPGAAFAAAEAQKQNRAVLNTLQSGLSLNLARMYRSTEDLATEFVPYVLRMLSPDVKPVIINTSSSSGAKTSTASVRRAGEKALVARAVTAMTASGVRFEKARVEFENAIASRTTGGWVYRMDPPLDTLGAFESMQGKGKADVQVRYAVRQVLEAEFIREQKRMEEAGRRKRGGLEDEDAIIAAEEAKNAEDQESKKKEIMEKEKAGGSVKRDFFGRVIKTGIPQRQHHSGGVNRSKRVEEKERRVWVTYHEGFSNAVRKPVTIAELMRGL